MKFIVIIFISLLEGFALGYLDITFDKTGTVIFKASENSSLCIRTERESTTNSIMRLVDCKTQYPSFMGNQRFDVGEIKNTSSFQLRTTHVPKEGGYATYQCLYTGGSQNPQILTEKCNYNSKLQRWSYMEISAETVQLRNNNTETCVRAPEIANSVLLEAADCDSTDTNQIWIKEFTPKK